MGSIINWLQLDVLENACVPPGPARVLIHSTGKANVASCLAAATENWTLRRKPEPGERQLHYSHYSKLTMCVKMSSAGEQSSIQRVWFSPLWLRAASITARTQAWALHDACDGFIGTFLSSVGHFRETPTLFTYFHLEHTKLLLLTKPQLSTIVFFWFWKRDKKRWIDLKLCRTTIVRSGNKLQVFRFSHIQQSKHSKEPVVHFRKQSRKCFNILKTEKLLRLDKDWCKLWSVYRQT